MKKFLTTVIAAVMAIGFAGTINPVKAEATGYHVGFSVADVVEDAKAVEAGEFSATSIPLRIQDDVLRIYIRKSRETKELEFKCEMLWGKFNPKPPALTANDIKSLIYEALG